MKKFIRVVHPICALFILLYPVDMVAQSLWEVLTDMEQENIFCDVAVGRGYTKDKQRERFDRLKAEATAEELLALTDDPNPVLRCYAFLALADNHHPEVFAVLLRHLADEEEVEVVSGCIGQTMTTGELFFAIAKGRYSEAKHPHTLTAEQKAQVEALLSLPADK